MTGYFRWWPPPVAAELIQQSWTGKRVVELEGPRRVSPTDIASNFGKILGREVSAEIVPRESWNELFVSQGMKHPLPRIQMLDGFNKGWIDFEGRPDTVVKGNVGLEDVMCALVEAG